MITQQKAQYQEEMIPEEVSETHSEVTDDLYDEAVDLIIGMQTAYSTSLGLLPSYGPTTPRSSIASIRRAALVYPILNRL